jgi:hypothetical protein
MEFDLKTNMEFDLKTNKNYWRGQRVKLNNMGFDLKTNENKFIVKRGIIFWGLTRGKQGDFYEIF